MTGAFDHSTNSASTLRNGMKPWLLPFAIVLINGALGFYQIGEKSLFVDEGYSIWDAERLATAHSTRIRPFFHVVLRAWSAFGDSESWLRSLSVLCGCGVVLATFCLGRVLYGNKEGCIAAFLVAIYPPGLGQAQMIRMYPMGTLLALVGSLYFLNVLRARSGRSIFVWSAARLCMLLTIPLAAPLLLADLLLLFATRNLRRGVLPLSIIVILWCPFAYGLLNDVPAWEGNWTRHFLPPGPLDVPRRILADFVLVPGTASRNLPYQACATALSVLAACGFLFRRAKGYGIPELALAAWGILPTVVLAMATWLGPYVWLLRYLLFAQPFVLLLVAHGLCSLPRPLRPAALLAYVGCVGLAINALRWYYRANAQQDWRAAALAISSSYRTGDLILVEGSHRAYAPLDYYIPDLFRSASILTTGCIEAERIWVVKRGARSPRPEGTTIIQKKRMPGLVVFLVRPAKGNRFGDACLK